MLSIFGTDLRSHCWDHPVIAGAVYSVEAVSLAQSLAHHFDTDFASIERCIAPVLPHSLDKISSYSGWALFGQHVASLLSSPAPDYRPTMH